MRYNATGYINMHVKTDDSPASSTEPEPIRKRIKNKNGYSS